jgi:hypothetical protein
MQVPLIQRDGLIICVSFSNIQDIIRIINVLKTKYKLQSTICYQAGKPMIFIDKYSLPLFRSIVTPYMHPYMFYIFHPFPRLSF